MKQLVWVSTVALLLLALALPTLAAGPTITDNPLTPFTVPAALGCGTFDVFGAPEAGKPNGGRIITFANSAIAHGPVFVTLTNATTGTSTNLNISGPAKASFSNNTEVTEGPTLFIGFPSLAPANLQGLAFGTGRTVIQFDSSGKITSVTFTGTAASVCPSLG